MAVVQKGFKDKKYTISDIKCGNCGCIFEQNESDFMYVIDLLARHGSYHAECPDCSVMPELKNLPTVVRQRILKNIECYRIQKSCTIAFPISDIKRKTERNCIFFNNEWWEMKCPKCKGIHIIPHQEIDLLPDIVVSVVSQQSARPLRGRALQTSASH